jgi:N-acyl-D-amino-acid deacylase
MKAFRVRLVVILTLGIVIGVAAWAQVYPGGNPYNPYTGKPMPQTPYNPLTGKGGAQQGVNPFTGKPGGPAVNPYTGKPMPQQGAYNPLVGNYQGEKTTATPTSPQVYKWPKGKYPVTGKAGPGLDAFDEGVQAMMARHGIPGAALAIAKDGKLVYARGFGWADLTSALNVNPLTLFGLASLSKPFTAMAILWLVEHGMLDLDDRVFDILKNIQPPPGAKVDPRLQKITVRQLLNHTGGWDRTKSGDPSNWEPQIANALGVPAPITDEQFISFIMTQPLDFEPGSRHEYSNIGYILLGRIVQKVSGQPYDQFVRTKIMQPAGIKQAYVSKGNRPYKTSEARRYLAGTSILLPPMDLPMVNAAGGWNASAVDMVRFLTALDGSRGKALLKETTFKQMLAKPPAPVQPRKDGTWNGLGWPTVSVTEKGFGYLHDGSFHGMRTFMKRSSKGVNWALLFNVSMNPDPVDANIIKQAIQEVRQHVENFDNYPAIDLFSEY